MSKTQQTTLEIVVEGRESVVDEKEDGKKPCPHGWCSERIHPNTWPVHIRNCTPPAGWDGGDE